MSYPKGITLVGGRWRVRHYIDKVAYNMGTFGSLAEAVAVKDMATKLTAEELLKRYPRGTKPGRQAGRPRAESVPKEVFSEKPCDMAKHWGNLTTYWHKAVTGAVPTYNVRVQ